MPFDSMYIVTSNDRPHCPQCEMRMDPVKPESRIFKCLRCGHVETRQETKKPVRPAIDAELAERINMITARATNVSVVPIAAYLHRCRMGELPTFAIHAG